MKTARPQKLDRATLDAFLAAHPAWREQDGALVRTYVLPSFAASIGFVVTIGFAAEKLDHHPDLSIAYTKVGVLLVTHDAGGLTALDLTLAQQINALAPSGTTTPPP